MVRYFALRLFQAALGLLVVATLTFAMVRLTGDPARLLIPEHASAEVEARVRANLGLDRPILEQYAVYLGGLIRLDLGNSYLNRAPVTEVMLRHLGATIPLALIALTLALAISIPLGLLSSIYRGSLVDRAARTLALGGQAIPSFLLALVLILVFAVALGWVPASQRGGFDSYVLPAIATAWATIAGLVRLTRSSMLDVLNMDYIRMARAKGLPRHVIYLKHALRNALIPVLTYTGLVLAAFMNGSIIAERVFAWPGLGYVALDAVTRRDFPMVQGTVLLTAAFLITINFIVDFLYVWVDPRIRYS